MKANRKAIPSNFVEIIDTLVDKIASYKGVALSCIPKYRGAENFTPFETYVGHIYNLAAYMLASHFVIFLRVQLGSVQLYFCLRYWKM